MQSAHRKGSTFSITLQRLWIVRLLFEVVADKFHTDCRDEDRQTQVWKGKFCLCNHLLCHA